MSEQTPEPNPEHERLNALFDSIADDLKLESDSIQDPYIAAAHAKVREYNDLFFDEPPTLEDSVEIEQAIDDSWYELNGEEVHLTGRIVVTKGKLKGVYYVDDIPAISRGFTVRGDAQTTDTSESGNESQTIIQGARLQHAFKIGKGALNAALEGKAADKKVYAFAEVDDVHISPSGISIERAKAWIQTTHPELFKALNERLLGDHEDEASALLSLRGLDLASLAPIDDDFTREAVEVYIRNLLDLDMGMPYEVSVDGAYVKKYENDTFKLTDEMMKKSVPAYVYGPYIECEIATEVSDKWDIVIELGVISPIKNDSTTIVRTSLNSVTEMHQTRRRFYA